MKDEFKIVGIDLAAYERNPSGWALYTNNTIQWKTLFKNDELVAETIKTRPKLICIDAPLSLPMRGKLREVDRKLIKRNLHVLPPLIKSMKPLTYRGILFKKIFEEKGFNVIEVHPTSSLKVLNYPRKKHLLIRKLAIIGLTLPLSLSIHELDAIICALTGKFYLYGKYMKISASDGEIVLPAINCTFEHGTPVFKR